MLAAGLAAASSASFAQEGLDVSRYVEIVLRSHPAAVERVGLEPAAEAESRAARVLPDPVFAFSWDRAHPTDLPGAKGDETSYALSQTLPWPGTRRAGVAAGDRAADILRAGAEGVGWEIGARARVAFARLEAARGLLDVARDAEEDARSLRDLVARRAELGESRESDRIKVVVEWLRQQRHLAAAEREARVAESVLRALAVGPCRAPVVLEACPTTPRCRSSIPRRSRAPRRRRTRGSGGAGRVGAARGALLRGSPRANPRPGPQRLPANARSTRSRDGFTVGIKLPLWNANRGEIARVGRRTGGGDRRGAEGELRRLDAELEAGSPTSSWRLGPGPHLLDPKSCPRPGAPGARPAPNYEEGETSLLDLLDAQRTFRERSGSASCRAWPGPSRCRACRRLAGPGLRPLEARHMNTSLRGLRALLLLLAAVAATPRAASHRRPRPQPRRGRRPRRARPRARPSRRACASARPPSRKRGSRPGR